jgi:hypothetical protein
MTAPGGTCRAAMGILPNRRRGPVPQPSTRATADGKSMETTRPTQPTRPRALASRRAQLAAIGETRFAVFTLALLMLVVSVLVYRKGLGTTFNYDEWNWVMNRRGWGVGTFLRPHNEHLSLIPVFLYKILFLTAGLTNYWVYRLMIIAVYLICVALLFALARRRLGGALALVVAIPLLTLGYAWNDLLWPFQIGLLGSVAFGLGMFLALDNRTLRGDVAAGLLLTGSLACSSLGVSFVVGAFVELIVVRVRWERLWVPLAPLALYGIWYLGYGSSHLLKSNIPAVPEYVADAAAAVAAAIVGLGAGWGPPLAVGLAALTIWRLVGSTLLPVRLLAALSTVLSFWILAALARAQLHEPGASRYLFPGAALTLLVCSELVPSVRLNRRGWGVAAILLAGAAVGNWGPLRDGSRYLQDWSSHVRAELGALELARNRVDPNLRPDPVRAPDITAGKYFAAIDQLGSPADRPSEIERQPEPQRESADAVLVAAVRPSLMPVGAARPSAPVTVDAVGGGNQTRSGICTVFRPAAPGASIDMTVPARGLILTDMGNVSVEIRLRRFADAFPTGQNLVLPSGGTRLLRIRPDKAPVPWHLRATGSTPVRICGAGG